MLSSAIFLTIRATRGEAQEEGQLGDTCDLLSLSMEVVWVTLPLAQAGEEALSAGVAAQL
jgi:hypothetical protein